MSGSILLETAPAKCRSSMSFGRSGRSGAAIQAVVGSRVSFWAVDPLKHTTVDVEVRIDPRGDVRADDLISFFRDEHTKVCNMGKAIEPRNQVGRVRMRGRYAACIVPLRWLHPGGKRIRWRLLSQTREGGSAYHLDRAPDHGWYR